MTEDVRDLSLQSIVRFSKDGDRIFCDYKADVTKPRETGKVKVDVWSYSDPQLQSQQLQELLIGPTIFNFSWASLHL